MMAMMVPAHGDGRAVERVHEARPLVGPVAAVQAPRLEVGAVRARGDLAVALLAGHPGLEVVLLGGRSAQVAGGDVDHAVGDAQAGEDVLLGARMSSCSAERLLGQAELEHLELVELVHTQDAARVLAGGAGFAAEAGAE